MKQKPRRPAEFTPEREEVPQDVKDALAVVADIRYLIAEKIDDRTRAKADDFFDSVLHKAKSIGRTVSANNRVSDAQLGALTSMKAAVRKWIHEDDDDDDDE